MRSKLCFCIVLLASLAIAKEPKPYQSGKVLQMDSVKCGADEKDNHKKTQALLCQEYVLQTDHVIYHIRPKDEKHLALLPVGEQAQFRMEKDKMVMRVEGLDNKDREYFIVSMMPRGDNMADAATPRMNHLQ